jgi:hypothetical protein
MPGIEALGELARSDYFARQLGAFDSDSLGRVFSAALENPRPVRQQIANVKQKQPKEAPIQREVTINIGDKVIQIVV